MGKFTGGQIVLLFRDGGRRPVSGLAHRVDECEEVEMRPAEEFFKDAE